MFFLFYFAFTFYKDATVRPLSEFCPELKNVVGLIGLERETKTIQDNEKITLYAIANASIDILTASFSLLGMFTAG